MHGLLTNHGCQQAENDGDADHHQNNGNNAEDEEDILEVIML